MSAIRWSPTLLVLAVFWAGCSNSEVDEAGNAGQDASHATLASLAPTTTPANQRKSESEDGGEETFIPPFPNNVDFFSPPKIIAPVVPQEPEFVEEPVVEPKPEPVVEEKEIPVPPLRLVGFVDVEELKALLSVDGQLSTIGIGDSRSGIEVVAVDPPAVTLKHGDNEFEINLFDQEWSDRGPAAGPLSRSRAGRRSTPKAPRLPTLPSQGARRTLSLPNARNSNPGSPRLPTSGRETRGLPRPPANPQDPPDADIPDRLGPPGPGLPALPGSAPDTSADDE